METKMLILPIDQAIKEIRLAVHSELEKWDEEKNGKDSEKLFTINQIAKRLGKSHATIKKLCTLKIIKTTKSGLITEQAINDYLANS